MTYLKILFIAGTRRQGERQIKRLAEILKTAPIEGVSLQLENGEPAMTSQGGYILNVTGESIYSNILARGVAEHHDFIVIEENPCES